MEQHAMVSLDRWSLYSCTLVSLRWPTEQPTVVTIYRQVVLLYKWSLRQVPLCVYEDRVVDGPPL